MTIAALTSARHAAGAVALAASAVSATLVFAREPQVTPAVEISTIEVVPIPTGRAFVRDVVVVGTPDYDVVAGQLHAFEAVFSHCARSRTRVTVYAHLSNGWFTDASALGLDRDAATCVRAALAKLSLAATGELDVMIPIDLVE